MVDDVSVVPPPADSDRRAPHGVLLTLETVICFAAPAFLVALGTVVVPIGKSTGALDVEGAMPVVQVLLGWAGLSSVAGLLRHLVARRPLARAATVLGLACGVAATVPFLMRFRPDAALSDQAPLVLLVCLPLACTAHLVFLARRSLFG